MGVDVNCWDDVLGLIFFLVYLCMGGCYMFKVLVKYNVEVKIMCGDFFENFVLYLVLYYKLYYFYYFLKFILGSDNWCKYL